LRPTHLSTLLIAATMLAGCSLNQNSTPEEQLAQRDEDVRREFDISDESFFDLFRDQGDPDRGVVVNRYLWLATLDVLSFLPLDTADPFSGIITTGWASVGGGAYRVTVLISEPALDARSLKVAAFRGGGNTGVPVSDAQNRALEDAILTRARQLRIAAANRGSQQNREQQELEFLVPGTVATL
jgi:Domain of unknown function (DUF3576)